MSTRSFTPLEKDHPYRERNSLAGFTILETVLAAILALLIMIGSVGVIQNMGRETERLKAQIEQDTTWMSANAHLAKTVRASSYLEIPNQNTLILHNYDATEKGRYVYNANQGRLEYWVNNNRTLQDTFNNVEAAFALKAGARRNNQPIEVIISYARPFANMLCLRCAVDVAPPASNSWALIIGGTNEDYPRQVIQTNDNNYVIVGSTKSFGFGDYDIYLMKISRDGKRVWSRTYGTNVTDEGFYVRETFAAGNVPDGFIIAGRSKNAGGNINTMVLIRTDVNGAPLWTRNYPRPGGNRYSYPGGIVQMFSSRTGGAPIGYLVATGGAQTGDGVAELWRLNLDGTVNWVRRIRYGNPNHQGIVNEDLFCVAQVFNASGAPAGCITGGETYKYYDGNNTHSTVFIIRVDDGGGYVWSYMYPRATYRNSAYFVNRIYTATGAPNGFLVGGDVDQDFLNQNPFFLRTNDDGSKRWSRVFPNHGGYNGDNFCGTWRLALDHTVSATTSEMEPYPGGGNISKPRAYLVNVSDAGTVGTTFFFNFPYKCITARIPAVDASGNFDGYILRGWSGCSGHPGLASACCFIVKTDINGSCPEANDVNLTTYIADAPTAHAIAYANTGGAAGDINLYGNPGNRIDSI